MSATPSARRSGTHLGLGSLLTGATLGVLVLACGAPRRGRPEERLHVNSISGQFRLKAEHFEETQSNATRTTEQTERLIAEALLLRVVGDYYHPKFIEYDLTGEVELQQSKVDIDGGGRGRDLDGQNLTYDLRTRLFKDLPYSSEFYTHRTETQTRQTFFETTENITEETGANLNAKSWWIPSRLHVDRYTNESRAAGDFREERDTLRLDGTRVEDAARYQYLAELSDVQLGTGTLQDFSNLRLSASSSHHLGEGGEDRWTNSASFRSQAGSIDTATSGFTSSLSKRWSDALTSDHLVQYSDSEIAGARSTTTQLSSGIGHQLFESLNSSLTAQAGRTEIDDGQIETVGGVGRLDYRKQTPLGALGIQHSADYYIQDEQVQAGLATEVDESHVFTPGTPIVLEQPNVAQLTIVVTDATGLILYAVGIDYLLSTQGLDTRLDIPPGSQISPGQTILVDYAFSPSSDLRFSNLSRSTRLSLGSRDAFDVSVSRSTVEQDILSGVDTGVLDDSTRTTASVRMYPAEFTVGADYEDMEGTIAPFQRLTYLASYEGPSLGRWSWRASTSTFTTKFPDDQEEETGATASVNLFGSFSREVSGQLRAEWREIDFRTDAGTGLFLEGSLTRRFRNLDLSFSARLSDESFDVASDRKITRILMTLTRRF